MTLEIWLTLGILLAAIILFASEKLPVDLIALSIMAALLASGIITPQEGIAGFSNPATVTVACMFVLSAALFRTGATNLVGGLLTRVAQRSILAAMLVVMLVIGGLSAFINNTAAVAVFLPIALAVSRDTRTSPSKWLMPLSFASMFGGVCTLIGTSTNILVSAIAEDHGEPAFRMFEFMRLGIPTFALGITYMMLVGVRLIPERRDVGDLTQTFGLGHYLTELVLLPGASSIGLPLRESPLGRDLDLAILEVRRDHEPVTLPSGDTVLQEGDRLLVRTSVEKIKKLQKAVGVQLQPNVQWRDQDVAHGETVLVEAVIAPNSGLKGRTLEQVRFRNRYGAVVLAIRHRGQLLHEKLATTELEAGDVLLIEVRRAAVQRLRDSPDFVLVSEVGFPEFRRRMLVPAVLVMTGVVLTAAFNVFPIVVSAILGCVLLALTGCVSLSEAYDAIEWRVIFLLAGVLTLGVALEKTGAAALLSSWMVGTVGTWGPLALLSAFYLLTSLLTQAISNNATAALLAPIALATARALEVDPRPFLVAVTFAASSSFMTPVGYQTNTLIYGPGQYRFRDFMRVGAPLTLLFWGLATWLIPRIWPF